MIGTVQATSVLLIAQLWFRIPFAGSFATLYAGLGVFLLAAVGIGLFLSSLVATMQQAMLFSFVVILPFSLLVGPDDADRQHADGAAILHLRESVALRDRNHAASLPGSAPRSGNSLPDLWPLAVIAVVMLTTAAWMFGRRLG